jgi:hypothetical protein
MERGGIEMIRYERINESFNPRVLGVGWLHFRVLVLVYSDHTKYYSETSDKLLAIFKVKK